MIKYKEWTEDMDFDLVVFFKWVCAVFTGLIMMMIFLSVMIADETSCYYSSVYKYEGGFSEYRIMSKVNWGVDKATYKTFAHDKFVEMFDKHENKCGFES